MRKPKGPMSVYSDIRRSGPIPETKARARLKPIQKDDPWLRRFDPDSFFIENPRKEIDREKS